MDQENGRSEHASQQEEVVKMLSSTIAAWDEEKVAESLGYSPETRQGFHTLLTGLKAIADGNVAVQPAERDGHHFFVAPKQEITFALLPNEVVEVRSSIKNKGIRAFDNPDQSLVGRFFGSPKPLDGNYFIHTPGILPKDMKPFLSAEEQIGNEITLTLKNEALVESIMERSEFIQHGSSQRVANLGPAAETSITIANVARMSTHRGDYWIYSGVEQKNN